MRNAVILVALCMLAFVLFSCEEKKPAAQETVKKEATPPATPPAVKPAQQKPLPAVPAAVQPPAEKKPAAPPAQPVAQKPAETPKPQPPPPAAKPSPEPKKAVEPADKEQAQKEAEAKKAADEKARKEAEAKKVAADKVRKEAEAKRIAEQAEKDKARKESAAKKAIERVERKRAKREASLGRFAELGITVKPTVQKIRLKLLGRFETFRGVEVVSVKPGSVAEKAGLKSGDLLEGICDRPIYHLSNVVDGMLRVVPVTDQLEEKHWTAAVAEGDALTKPPRFSIVRDGAQMDLPFSLETFRLNRDNYVMAVVRYENPLAERADVIGGAIFCAKRARHFKGFAFFGPIFEVKEYDTWKDVRLLLLLAWREGAVGDVEF
ncbi:MAG: hypothetical protein AB1696_09845 [Planctomycetota bacterium]